MAVIAVNGLQEKDSAGDGLVGPLLNFCDLQKGLPINMPDHYFPHNDPSQKPVFTWRGHANLLFCNWLNYYVYQATPYDLDELHEQAE